MAEKLESVDHSEAIIRADVRLRGGSHPKTRELVGHWNSLCDKQKEAALAYRGPENHGSDETGG